MVSAIGSALVNYIYALVPLAPLVDQIWPMASWALVIMPSLLVTVFSLGIGLIIAAL